MVDAHAYALLSVLELLGEGCSEAFGNCRVRSSEKSWASFSKGNLIVLATTGYCNVGNVLVQPVGERLFGFSFLNSDVFNLRLISRGNLALVFILQVQQG